MDKNEKIALGLAGIAAAGVIGYKYLTSKKQQSSTVVFPPVVYPPTTGASTSTSQQEGSSSSGAIPAEPWQIPTAVTLTLKNDCDEPVTVEYTDPSRSKQHVSINAHSSVKVTIDPAYAIEVIEGDIHRIIESPLLISGGTITVCPFSKIIPHAPITTGGFFPDVTVTLKNDCDEPVTVEYLNSSGNSTITINAHSSATVSVRFTTNIVVKERGTNGMTSYRPVGPVMFNHQTITVCPAQRDWRLPVLF